MRVIRLKVRTPGIFLGRPDLDQGIPAPVLDLQIRDGEEWKPVEEISNIKLLKENFLPSGSIQGSTSTLEVATAPIEIPLQGEGTKYYNLLVPDDGEWEFRIVATPCIDCVRMFRSYGKEEKIINGVGVVVAEGQIKAYNGNT